MCWFELVDLWTNDIDRDQYVDFLQAEHTHPSSLHIARMDFDFMDTRDLCACALCM